MRNILLISLVAIPFLLAYKKLSDQLKYSIRSIKLKSVSLTGINFDLVFEILNPTDKEVEVKNIVFDVIYKTSVLATGQQLTPFTIKPSAKTVLTISAKSAFIALTQSLIDALKIFIQQKIKPVVNITGVINISEGSLNINSTQQIG